MRNNSNLFKSIHRAHWGISAMSPDNRLANNAFIGSVVNAIPGFPSNFCFACLMDMLDMQRERDWRGSLLEIGVYAGRFSAVLARDAARRASHLVGLDPFVNFPASEVRERLEEIAGKAPSASTQSSAKITLVEDFSGNWTSGRLL